jgi:surface antigen
MEGQIAGEQERRQRDLQAYQQAVSQFQIGHQLEQESRQRAADPYRLALQYAPQVVPTERAGFISESLGHIGDVENQPFTYGASQFNDIQNAYRAGNPNAARFNVPNVPVGNNPWVPQMPPAGAFDQGQAQAAPQEQPPPGPAPTPLVHASPELLNAFGNVLGQPRADTTPLTPDQMAQQAVGGAFPTPAPPPANGLGNELTYQTNQQFPGGMPLRSPNQVPPLGTGPGPVEAMNQGVFGSLLPAFQAVQARQQGVMDTAGAQGGPSGSNPTATQPPNTRGQLPDQTPQMGGGAPVTSTAGAPPPPVPPSASVGTAPQTVPAAGGPPAPTAGTGVGAPPPNVLHIPGFSRDYAYGEVDQAAQTRAVARRQAALAHLRDINAPPELLQQVQDLIGRSPNPDTQAGLQQYDFVTQQVESLGIGQGASIYRARQAALHTPSQLITQFLAIVGKSGRANDPTWVRQTALGMGIDPALADTLAAGDFGAPEVRKLLGKALDKIYTPGFGQLDPTTQNSLLDAARGYAETLGQKIELPAQVVLQLTPAQRARLDLERTRITQSGRAQDIAEGRLRLAQWQTQARIDGLLGGAGGGKGGKLTANAELLAARKPYDEALGVYKSLRAQKAYEDARDAYDTAKNNLLALHPEDDTPGKERADIEHIINDPRTDDKARILANADLRRLRTADAYQQKTAALVSAGQPATAPAGARTVVPNFVPGGQGAGAPAGVPGPGQGNPQAMIFTNPSTGEKRRVVADPSETAQRLLRSHPEWKGDLAKARRVVQTMIQEAKSGRSR